MDIEDKNIQAPQQTESNSPQADNTYDRVEGLLKSISDRLDNLEKNRLSARGIKEMAERKIIEQEVAREEESIKLNRQYANWEKGKNHWEIRNAMWEECTNQFLREDIPRSHIHAGMVDGGWNSGIGQLLSICLFRYMAPMNGIPLNELEGISLTRGEHSFKIRNNPKEILRI